MIKFGRAGRRWFFMLQSRWEKAMLLRSQKRSGEASSQSTL